MEYPMKTYIALIRGINVGRQNSISMKELILIFESLGCQNVKTYINSGNVIFAGGAKNTPQLSAGVGAEIKKRRGFEPHTLIIGIDELETAVANNPFRATENDPKALHVGFLEKAPPKPDLKALEGFKRDGEQFRLIGKCFYLFAPDGVGRSALAAHAEKLLGVPMTDRNWRTVCTLLEMSKEKE